MVILVVDALKAVDDWSALQRNATLIIQEFCIRHDAPNVQREFEFNDIPF